MAEVGVTYFYRTNEKKYVVCMLPLPREFLLKENR